MDNGEVFMKLMHLATQNQIAVKFVPFTVSYARLKGNPQGMRMGISQNLQTIEEVNYNFDTYNSLTPNWYYKVLR